MVFNSKNLLSLRGARYERRSDPGFASHFPGGRFQTYFSFVKETENNNLNFPGCSGAPVLTWLALAAALFLFTHNAFTDDDDWWPTQAAPAEVVSVPQPSDPAERILLEGLAGLWARAVNEGRGDALLWIDRPVHYRDWKEETLLRLDASTRGQRDVWRVFSETIQAGYLNGFVVYHLGPPSPSEDDSIDHSLNIATMLAGVLDAAIVDESLVSQMLDRGLTQLADARTLSYEDVWTQYADEIDDSRLFINSPINNARVERMRDLAVAHRGKLAYGVTETTAQAMRDTTVPGPVFGWNHGDEFSHIAQGTRHGLFNTVSNWLSNITVLSAGSVDYNSTPIPAFDPATIDWADQRMPVSFVMSDGDNTGWVARGFWGHASGSSPGVFWDHPEHGDFPMGFTVATSDLEQFAPVVIDRLATTKPEETTVIHFSAYYYPDLFATERHDRAPALRKLAQMKARQMKKTGAVTMTFICENATSSASMEAMQIFAEEIHPLLGMLVMDYSPYNASQGQILWLDDGRGGQVPVVTPRYTLWHGMNSPNAGSPEEVAGFIDSDAGEFNGAWAVVHAWSKFPRPEGSETDQGVPAVRRAVEAIDDTAVKVASPEEMLWRLRVAHNRHHAERLNEEIHDLSAGTSPRLGAVEKLFESSFDPDDGIDYSPENRPQGWFGDDNSSHPIRVWASDAERSSTDDSGYFGEVIRSDGNDHAWWMTSRIATGGSSTYTITFDFKPNTYPFEDDGGTVGDIDFVYRNWGSEGNYLGPDIKLSLHNASGSIGEAAFSGTNNFLNATIGDPDDRGWRTVTITGETTSPDAAIFDLWFVGRDSFTGSFAIDNVTVTDGIQTASPLTSWRLLHFGTTENTGDAANSADFDGNGFSNLLEYATGSDPTEPAGRPAIDLKVEEGILTLTFDHIDDPSLTYVIESTDDLGREWSDAHTYPPFQTSGPETYQDSVPVAEAGRRFIRLNVTSTE